MNPPLKNLKKLLVANRGEIAVRILRAAAELNVRTVAMFTFEDRYSLHRFKADEAYQIGESDAALKPYLDIEAIIALAKLHGVDAIHPGYGFLSENPQLARRCREEGIIFVGPEPEVMEALGDKITAKRIAREAGLPVIEDSQLPLSTYENTLAEALRIGFPLMVKAASGGGGRGMRVVKTEQELQQAYAEAKSEAGKAFGDDTLFLEKYIMDPKHIEVQIMADNHGNLVHLFERDCSVQRRFQKVVEVAPAPNLPQEIKDKLYEYALAITRKVNYNNVGTVEFLVDPNNHIYFIEVNPRIQVEHTITEEITKVDIVRSQILIAKGHKLSDPQIFLASQDDVQCRGFAVQCRITTEDPENGFQPDFGTIITYRTGSGFGIRLDEGSTYAGMKVSPFFDSLLVKVSCTGRTMKGTCQRLLRALREFRIRGVKTNIGFLENVISNHEFQNGHATVNFIERNPNLFKLPKRTNRAVKLVRYLADLNVNGHPDVKHVDSGKTFREPKVPSYPAQQPPPPGLKQKLEQMGAAGLAQWVKNHKPVLVTDTTFRDAHQSLLATRMRTVDMLKVAPSLAWHQPNLFSVEAWGGATFDVALRFLHECPWERLRLLRAAMPNVLIQMLLRASNAVGYKAYPDNLVEKFIEKAAENGVDVFRIFDSLNNLNEIKISIAAIKNRTNAVAEASICYTGDLQDPKRTKYNLAYYLDKAKRLEDYGAHMLCIKDMAGLLKPYAAAELIAALKEAVNLPIHLHTHDTASIQAATYLKAIEAGVDIVDVALASMSGLTSQPNFNALAAMLKGHERAPETDLNSLNLLSNYWEDVREMYYPFESELKAGTAQVYEHEIPGGQYSNLRPQARSLGLEHRFEEIKKNYAVANRLFGDIVKVTPSSKIVGDFALFLTTHNLTEENLFEKGAGLSFPESVKEFFKGQIGFPEEGLPEPLSRLILGDEKPLAGRPNAYLPTLDLEKDFAGFLHQFGSELSEEDYLSWKMYPKVFEEYHRFNQEFGVVSKLPTSAFFYGLKEEEEVLVELSTGKLVQIKLLGSPSQVDENGMRRVSFQLNGQNIQVQVRDRAFQPSKKQNQKVSKANEIGSPLQGKLSAILVKPGDEVKAKQPLFIIEAMKMETIVSAPANGKVVSVALEIGSLVEKDDLVLTLAG